VRLNDAIQLCDKWSAKLIIRDPDSPLRWGTITKDGFGTMYIWTMGHTAPMMQCQYTDDKPAEADQDVCYCGRPHGFPKGQRELLYGIALSEDWEPVWPITVLDALIREPPEEK